jgi:hypothetical protein
MKSSPSENILKLRELTEKLCDLSHKDNCEKSLIKIKQVIDESSIEISQANTYQSKINCYEKMYKKIKNIFKDKD